MTTADYRLSINGFTCLDATRDDILNFDGNGDEVYFRVNTRVASGIDGSILNQNVDTISATMGDVQGWAGRVKAGSGGSIFFGATGGLFTGNSFPSATPWLQSADPAGRDHPPFVIWEGSLTQGSPEVHYIMPTIWEYDIGGSILQNWIDWQVSVDQKFGKRAKDIFGGIWPVASPVFDAVSLGIETFATLSTNVWSPLAPPFSRPIGLKKDGGNASLPPLYNPTIIALNYDSAEYLVAANLTGRGRGLITAVYEDDPSLKGHYQIWLQLEKIGSTSAIDWQGNWNWCAKCAGLFHAASQLAGVCPAGGPHDHKGVSGRYALAHNSPSYGGQADWRWCAKCAGLFHAGGASLAGSCPAGGQHEKLQSGNYSLAHNTPSAVGQAGWRWCHNCSALCHAGSRSRLFTGLCPAGDPATGRRHEVGSSGEYTLSHTPR